MKITNTNPVTSCCDQTGTLYGPLGPGAFSQTNLDTYTPLRIGDTPELDIAFVASGEAPVGLGEPPTTAVAPAIGNAIFAATGARLRHLPITPAAVRSALTA